MIFPSLFQLNYLLFDIFYYIYYIILQNRMCLKNCEHVLMPLTQISVIPFLICIPRAVLVRFRSKKKTVPALNMEK